LTNPGLLPHAPVEVAWFSALCDDDYEFLGVANPTLRSSYDHCRAITLAAQQNGFDNILLPSGYELGIDATAFAAAMAPEIERINLLLAVRCGELWPPQLARQIATLDQMLHGHLTINIISSDLPGAPLTSGPRYRRTTEVIQILRTLLSAQDLSFHGEFFDLDMKRPSAETTRRTCPPLYFGGLSDDARECAAAGADVYLMWPDTMDAVANIITDMRRRATRHNRSLRFGYRVHVVVRETEHEARIAAERLLSQLDPDVGEAIRQKSLDTASTGVRRQAELRDQSITNDGYAEANLWTGIARARSGCGAAIVGDPEQVLAKLRAYQQLGIDAFILSGYPHRDECDLFARYVLPNISHAPLHV
jgi:alkanesulfonate monooxygenase